MENNEGKQILMSEYAFDEEEEKRLKAENSRKKLKAILVTLVILLTGFITFSCFFFNYMEENAKEYKLQQAAAAQKTGTLKK